MTIEEMLAEAEIRRVMVAYNIAGDRGQVEELAAQFAPDGVLSFLGVVARGRAEIATALGRRSGGPEPDRGFADRRGPVTKLRHHLTTSQVVVEGDEARGRSYFLVINNHGPDHMGVYVDRFRKVDGRWLIADREVRIDWQAGEA